MIAGMVAAVPMFVGIARNVVAFAEAHPERVSTRSGPGYYSIDVDGPMPPDMMVGELRWFMLLVVVVGILSIALLAAAVVRRLHDSGRRGWWGLLPLPFFAIGMTAMVAIFGRTGLPSGEPELMPFALLFGNNVLYLAALAMLVVQLCRPSDPRANRFGPPLD